MSRSDKPRIVSTPGTCGGRPRIQGHRIRVQDVVVWHERQKMSPEVIVLEYPGLTLDDVASALNYYQGHRAEIEDFLKADDDFAEKIDSDRSSVLIHPPRKLDAQDHPFPLR